jgi:conjugal transfer pilus assembly protein TraV
VLCTSVAGVYANSVENNLPSQRIEKRPVEPATRATAPARMVPTLKPLSDGAALRSSARILRLWVAPWEDSDGDLHEQAFLYVVVDPGRWLIERNRSAIRDEFMPITPPRTTPPVASEGTTSGREPRSPLPLGDMVPPAASGPAPNEEQPDAR